MQLTISVTEETKKELDKQAKEASRTRSGHITELVREKKLGWLSK